MITREHYVKRLKMLIEGEAKEVCHTCPLDGPISSCARTCSMCRDFINLPCDVLLICPCKDTNCGPEEAIQRAFKALKQWDNGTHKWQKEI